MKRLSGEMFKNMLFYFFKSLPFGKSIMLRA